MSGSEFLVRDAQGQRFDFEDESAVRTWSSQREDLESLEVQLHEDGPWLSLAGHLSQGTKGRAPVDAATRVDDGPAFEGEESDQAEGAEPEAAPVQTPATAKSESVADGASAVVSEGADPGQTTRLAPADIPDIPSILTTQQGGLTPDARKNPPPLPASIRGQEGDVVPSPSVLDTQGYGSPASQTGDDLDEVDVGPRDTEEFPHPVKFIPVPDAEPRNLPMDPLGPLIAAGQEVASIDVVGDESYDSLDDLNEGEDESDFEGAAALDSADLSPIDDKFVSQHPFEKKPSTPSTLEDRPTTQQTFEDRPTTQRTFEDRPTTQRTDEHKPTIRGEQSAGRTEASTDRYTGRDGERRSDEPAFVSTGAPGLGMAGQGGSRGRDHSGGREPLLSQGRTGAHHIEPSAPEVGPTAKYPIQTSVPDSSTKRQAANWLLWLLLVVIGADLAHRVFVDTATTTNVSGRMAPIAGIPPLGFNAAVVDQLVDANRLMTSGDPKDLEHAQQGLKTLTSVGEGLSAGVKARTHAGLAEVALSRAELARRTGKDPKPALAEALEVIAMAKAAEALPVLKYLEAEHARISERSEGFQELVTMAKGSGRNQAELRRLDVALAVQGSSDPAQMIAALDLLAGEAGGLLTTTLFKVEVLEKAGKLVEATALLEAVIRVRPKAKHMVQWLSRLRAIPKTPVPTVEKRPVREGGRADDRAPASIGKTGSPVGSFEALMAEGSRLLERGRAKQAKDYFMAATQLKPGAPEPVSNLGWCALELRDIKGAKRFFEKSLSAVPRFEDGLYGLGIAHQKLGNLNAAQTTYRKYLDAHPGGSKATMVRRRLEKLSGGH